MGLPLNSRLSNAVKLPSMIRPLRIAEIYQTVGGGVGLPGILA